MVCFVSFRPPWRIKGSRTHQGILQLQPKQRTLTSVPQSLSIVLTETLSKFISQRSLWQIQSAQSTLIEAPVTLAQVIHLFQSLAFLLWLSNAVATYYSNIKSTTSLPQFTTFTMKSLSALSLIMALFVIDPSAACDTACSDVDQNKDFCFYACYARCNESAGQHQGRFLSGLKSDRFNCTAHGPSGVRCTKSANFGACGSHYWQCGKC